MSRVYAALKKADYQPPVLLSKPVLRPLPPPIQIEETVGLWDRVRKWVGADRRVPTINHKDLRKQTIRSTSR